MITEVKRDLVALLKEVVGDVPITYDFLGENTAKGLVVTNLNMNIESNLSNDLIFDTVTADIMIISPYVNEVDQLADALLRDAPYGVGWIRGLQFTGASFTGDPTTGLHVCTLNISCEVNANGPGD
nr:MAG TPA: hypothetical protein [Caudoviricetes sp.]